jgi:diguanylate cyclase (GGDEF)-like protein/PAS domain S-box-containing protein
MFEQALTDYHQSLEKTLEYFRYRHALIVEAVSEGVLELDAHGTIIATNPAALLMTGYASDELLGQNHHILFSLAPTGEQYTYKEDCPVCATFRAHETRRVDNATFLCKDHSQLPVAYISIPMIETGQQPGAIIIFRDMTEQKAAESKLRHQALHDTLTNLPNRTLFLELLGHAMRYARRYQSHQFAVLFLDLDNFKVINESLGPMEGDQLLIITAGRLKACLSKNATIARFGGDEFAILLEDIQGTGDVLHVVAQIQKELDRPLLLHGHQLTTSACIGIAMNSSEYLHPADMLRDADTAMYRAKALGAGRYALFDATMRTSAWERLDMQGTLRRAIEQNELCLYYQPIVELATKRLCGFEALVRWQHPQRGLVSPDNFIPLAEETGLIIPLGWWVLEEACRQLGSWKKQFALATNLFINVNLSSQSFATHELVDRVAHLLQENGLIGERLKLEITESTIMDMAETTFMTLTRLRNLGVHLCIDDFGTGYSSLRYLHRLPIQTLKIDKSFITGLPADAENLVITQSIVTLSHALGKDVVAEGIETPEQLVCLQELDCEYGQGYLFSKPVAAEDSEELLRGSGVC